jgi:ParB/RepB/Spo0J family partition protein
MLADKRKDLLMVDPDSILIDPQNDYTTPDRGDTEGLKRSIRANGIHDPLRCSRLPDGSLRLNSGFRRLRLVLELNAEDGQRIERVPVLLTDRHANETDLILDQLLENAFREGAAPLEEAKVFAYLLKMGLDVHEISDRLGYSISFIQGRLALLTASPEVQAAMTAGELGVTAASTIVHATSSPEKQSELLNRARGAKKVTAQGAREITRTRQYRTTRSIKESERARILVSNVLEMKAFKTDDEAEPAMYQAYLKAIDWFMGGEEPWKDTP